MRRAVRMTAIACATCAATVAGATPPRLPPAQNVTIPFASHDGIENWEADGNKGLYIQSRDHHWYYATFFAPCAGLAFHEALGFKFGPGGELDRWSEVVTRDSGRCSFTSLVASDGPPRKPKTSKPKAGKAPGATGATPAPAG